MGKPLNLIGQRFGRLLVIEKTEQRVENGSIVWKCRCDCGNETSVRSDSSRSGFTASCKCSLREHGFKHGHSNRIRQTREYMTWAAMIQRCFNPNRTGYKNYGGRGIAVCAEWKNSFENFLAYLKTNGMFPKPPGLSIDRIENNGNYEPGNVRWATPLQQLQNQR